MDIYLPIAELPLNLFLILGMGGAVGFLSGLFGVGGGFLLTPLLIFTGITPAVAVATGASQIVASSVSGTLTYVRRGAVDFKLGGFLLVSGIAGSTLGVILFTALQRAGQLDLVISLSYVVFLGTIGGLMVLEAVRAVLASRSGTPRVLRRPGQHNWVHGLPFKVRFRRSRLYVSAIPILVLGLGIGFLGSILGIGGGIIMVPALIYLLKVPTSTVVGTTLLQTFGTMAFATVTHAVTNQSVDIVLGLALMVGSVIGSQLGARVGQKVRGETLRLMLGLLILGIGVRFAVELVIPPREPFSVTVIRGADL